MKVFKFAAITVILLTLIVLLPQKVKSQTSVENFASFEAVYDIDGNMYKTIKIGNQIWMAENLKVTHYQNGEPISNITNHNEWKNLRTGAWSNYNNDNNISSKYGKLYNWFAVNDRRNIAPKGWRVPTDEEWSTLINNLGGSSAAGSKLKSKFSWNNSNIGSTNISRFNALPGGYLSNGVFEEVGCRGLGSAGYWWTSTEFYKSFAWSRCLFNDQSNVSRGNFDKTPGYSVRCIKIQEKISVTDSVVVVPPLLVDSIEVARKEQNVVDIDGNIYKTVTIGTQTWMAENLKVNHYRNGDEIPNLTSDSVWSNLTTGALCNYDNDAKKGETYGKLFNWYAVNDSRSIAPIGWHVASNVEWEKLTDYLGGESVAGGKLKAEGIVHWNSPNEGADNSSGFSSLPGGYRNFNGAFGNVGNYGFWWSSVASTGFHAWDRSMSCKNSNINLSNYAKLSGYSVRCVKDYKTTSQSGIVGIETPNKTVSSGRTVTIRSNLDDAVLFIDGNSVGKTPFQGTVPFGDHNLRIEKGENIVRKTITIYPTGEETDFLFNFELPRITDIDGNIYHTVKIGTQTWMAENLRVSHYRNGDIIPKIMTSNEWSNLTTGAFCDYNNDTAFGEVYGGLYNWYAVTDVRKIAPVGFHIPTDEEWTTLVTFLGASTAGAELKETGTTHWNSPNTGATNTDGFSALPGGSCHLNGVFTHIGETGFWWSTTEYSINDVYCRYIVFDGRYINRNLREKSSGFSIRCIRDL